MLAMPVICMLPEALLAAEVSIAPAGAIAVLSALESVFEEQAPIARRLMSTSDIFAAKGDVVINVLVG